MNFVIYKKYNKEEELVKVCLELKKQSVEYLTENTGNSLSESFGNSTFANDYILKIQQKDFSKANKIIDELFNSELNDIDKSYFLFDFSNEELKDVIKKKDEWGDFNFSLAKKNIE